jgi:hypothetical protein
MLAADGQNASRWEKGRSSTVANCLFHVEPNVSEVPHAKVR